MESSLKYPARLASIAVIVLLSSTNAAYAYIGPGLGLGSVAVILGIVGSVLLAVVAIVWYPLKRLLKKITNKEKTTKSDGKK